MTTHAQSEARQKAIADAFGEAVVGGHGILPSDGQLISPLAVMKSPH
jgi:hypothetical protein